MKLHTGHIRRLLTPSSREINQVHFRTYMLFKFGTVAAVIIHLLLIPLFWIVGVFPMVVVNMGSVAIYAAAYLCNQRGLHVTTILLAFVELLLHQTLCVYYLGWESGFQYYIITLAILVFFLPSGRNVLKLALFATTLATFLGLLTYSQQTAPLYIVAPSVLSAFRNVNIVIVFCLLGLLAQSYTNAAEAAESRIEEERERAETLLQNILPVPIAARLKSKPQVIADGFDSASILFSDIVGFTPLSERMPPEQVVQLLNEIFSEFDDLVADCGLEKIKTIGDAYMVAAGIPKHREDHAEAVAELALKMMDVLKKRVDTPTGPLRMRIGIGSGPVVAGVIGKRKFIYDLWGDSVNTAARMESHGLPGEIQVSKATYEILKDKYAFKERGTILVKGKGPMQTFLLRGKKPVGEAIAPPSGFDTPT